MIYLERRPGAPLAGWIRRLWYACAPSALHRCERVLPNGCVQIVINLHRDFLWQCAENGREGRLPASLIVGARSACEIVDTADMADLIGVIFEPGGFTPFAFHSADVFSNQRVSLAEVWGPKAGTLRERLFEASSPRAKLDVLEDFLAENFAARLSRNSAVDHALARFAQTSLVSTVNEVAGETGWSVRRFSQIFREQVGLTPKTWCRIQRFQRAVRQLHAGADVPWAEMAVECGYYDQSHFANEFRAFSGIDATTYSARRGQWANHIPIE